MEGEDVVEQWFTVTALKVADGLTGVEADDASFDGEIKFHTLNDLAPKLGYKIVLQWRKPTTTLDEFLDAVAKHPEFHQRLRELLDIDAKTATATRIVEHYADPNTIVGHMRQCPICQINYMGDGACPICNPAPITTELITEDRPALLDAYNAARTYRLEQMEHAGSGDAALAAAYDGRDEAELPSSAEAEFEADLVEDDRDGNRDVEPF